MYLSTPHNLVRFNLRIRRDHLTRLALLANKLAKRKGRDVRLGEALEAALTVGLAWEDQDLLDLATPDKVDSQWLLLGPIHRRGDSTATTPAIAASKAPI